MSLVSEFDAGPLSWVKGEIDQALKQAQEKLAQFSPEDATPLKLALTHLHQVTGAIQMVGIDGAARFSEALEKLVAGLSAPDAADHGASPGLAAEAMGALQRHIEELAGGAPNVPLRLFPLYRAMLEACGNKGVSETDLFFPDTGLRAPKNLPTLDIPDAELGRHVAAQRTRFQRGLLGWLRNDHDAASLTAMREALQQVEASQRLPAHRTFWWTASALFDALCLGGLAPSPGLKQLGGRIDQQIRRLAEGSPKVAERLLREVLFHVARAKPISDRIKSVQATFELADYLPPAEEQVRQAQDRASRLQPVLRGLREQLAPARDAWLKATTGNRDALRQFVDCQLFSGNGSGPYS